MVVEYNNNRVLLDPWKVGAYLYNYNGVVMSYQVACISCTPALHALSCLI